MSSLVASPASANSNRQPRLLVHPVLPLMDRSDPDLPQGSPAVVIANNGHRREGVIIPTNLFGRLTQLEIGLAEANNRLTGTNNRLTAAETNLNNANATWALSHIALSTETDTLRTTLNGTNNRLTAAETNLNNANATWALSHIALSTETDTLRTTLNDAIQQRAECPLCFEMPDMRLSCGHVICQRCITPGLNACPSCRELFSSPPRRLRL